MLGSVIPWAVAISICAIAAMWDGLWRRIPNRLTAPALLAGFAWASYVGGWRGLGDAAVASLVMGLPFVLLFALSLGGAGDAKLMAAVGAWLGLRDGISALVWVVLCGGVLGLSFALLKKNLPQVIRNLWIAIGGALITAAVSRRWAECVGAFPRTENMQWMPYGIPILVGVCLAAGGFKPW